MGYGIPYMGSKQAIVSSLALNFPEAEHFYDLFGGGFSMTHYMLQHKAHRYKTFHYNEIQEDVVQLVKDSINGKYRPDVFTPEFIEKEKFDELKKSDAYIRILWSFGNSGTHYLYGADIRDFKKSAHNAIVFSVFDDFASKVLGFNRWPEAAKTIRQRRHYWRQRVTYLIKCNYSRYKRLEHLEHLEQLERLGQLQHLERLQRLGHLERLEGLERLTISAKDYRCVDIQHNSVVYCDIPYAGTAGYGKVFSHKDFFDWAASRKFPVFISEYNISDKRFKLIYEVSKTKLAQPGGNPDSVGERLYWNGV